MDSCSLSAVLDTLTPALPSLVGTLIGGAVTLLAACMTARHQNKLEDKRLDASREDEWRRFERDNLVGLQEAVQCGMRATGKCCLQMDKLATEGKEWADWIVDPADSEMQRQSLEDILLLSCRIDDVELVKALSLFRQKAHNVTSDSRTRTQLFDSMRELSDAYDAAMEVISEKLKSPVRCLFSQDRVYMSARTGNGEARDICPVRGDGQELEIGFNNRYLMDALR